MTLYLRQTDLPREPANAPPNASSCRCNLILKHARRIVGALPKQFHGLEGSEQQRQSLRYRKT
jgi:hypothetical protein